MEEKTEVAVAEETTVENKKPPVPKNQPRYVDIFGMGEDVCIVTYEQLTDTFTFAINHQYFTRIAKRNLEFLTERIGKLNFFDKEEITYIRRRVFTFKEELCKKGILNS